MATPMFKSSGVPLFKSSGVPAFDPACCCQITLTGDCCVTDGINSVLTLSITASTCGTLPTQDVTFTHTTGNSWVGNILCNSVLYETTLSFVCDDATHFHVDVSQNGLLGSFAAITCGPTFSDTATINAPNDCVACAGQTFDATLSG